VNRNEQAAANLARTLIARKVLRMEDGERPEHYVKRARLTVERVQKEARRVKRRAVKRARKANRG
jgi:hypothetical protein